SSLADQLPKKACSTPVPNIQPHLVSSTWMLVNGAKKKLVSYLSCTQAPPPFTNTIVRSKAKPSRPATVPSQSTFVRQLTSATGLAITQLSLPSRSDQLACASTPRTHEATW